MTGKLKPVGTFKKGEWILWEHRTWYEVGEDVKLVGGWAFITLRGHALSVCTIWHTVEMPHGYYRNFTRDDLLRALVLLPAR